jgi:hypothetical protein
MAQHPDIPALPLGLADITQTPRKYGLHATLKPPFSLRDGVETGQLQKALGQFCASRAPVSIPQPTIARLGSFLAIAPRDPVPSLHNLAADIVTSFDMFRAPLTQAERAKRRNKRLSPRQQSYLDAWGYPYVLDEFRFHITLTGRLPKGAIEAVEHAARIYFAPVIKAPMPITQIALLGEDTNGCFHVIKAYSLGR